MQCTALLHFDPFVCDPGNACLRRGEQVIHLTPKAFAVLSYLLERAGQLAAKEEILQAVWPETTLSETVLAVTIRELRRALQDNARTPRFIETVHRRGYRFMATLQTIPGGPTPLPTMSPLPGNPLCIGRSVEFAQLDQWLMKSLSGERQIGFIAGETGIGKTALVQAFVERVQAQHTLWVGYGQCVEQYGTGEAYLPILQALGRLGRAPEGQQLIAILRHYAPT